MGWSAHYRTTASAYLSLIERGTRWPGFPMELDVRIEVLHVVTPFLFTLCTLLYSYSYTLSTTFFKVFLAMPTREYKGFESEGEKILSGNTGQEYTDNSRILPVGLTLETGAVLFLCPHISHGITPLRC